MLIADLLSERHVSGHEFTCVVGTSLKQGLSFRLVEPRCGCDYGCSVFNASSPEWLYRKDSILSRLIGVGVILIFVYIVALPNWSVQIPGSDKHLQIGFGTANWTLTAIGKQDKQVIQDATPEKLLMAEAGFSHDGAISIWSSWTVALAGSLLLLSYFCGFIAWTSGFACLAKHRSNAQP